MKKRLVSFLLAISMVLTFLPVSAITAFAANQTAGEVGYTFTDSQNVKYTITKAAGSSTDGEVKVSGYENSLSGDVTIPETVTDSGKSYKVTAIGETAFNGCNSLTNITIPNSIRQLGYNSFKDCTSLKSITTADGKRPNSVGSDASSMFSGCTSLETIKLPNFFRDIYGNSYFSCLTNLREIEVYGGGTIQSSAFSNCTNLESVKFRSGFTAIENKAFYNCTNLKNIIPIYYTNYSGYTNYLDQIKTIGQEAFEGCTSLNDLLLHYSIESIGANAFSGSGLTNLGIRNILSLKSIDANAFANCSKLTSFETDASKDAWDNLVSTNKVQNDPSKHPGVTSKFNYGKEVTNTVTFDYGNGTIVTNRVDSGKAVDTSNLPATPKAYGWYTDEALTKPFDLSNVTESVTLYPRTTPNKPTLTATAEAGDHKVDTSVEINVTFDPGEYTNTELAAYNAYLTFTDADDKDAKDAVSEVKLNNKTLTEEQLHALTTNGCSIADLMSAGATQSTANSTPISLAVTFNKAGTYNVKIELKDSDSNVLCSADASQIKVVEKEPATLNMTVAQGEHKVKESVKVKVSVTPNDYGREISNSQIIMTYDDDVASVELKGRELKDKSYDVSTLASAGAFEQEGTAMTATLNVTYTKPGKHEFTVEIKNGEDVLCSDTATIEIAKEEEKPTNPEKPADSEKPEPKPEEPETPVIKLYDLTIKNAEVTIADADGKAVETTKNEDGTLTAKVPEKAAVTVKYTAPTNAIVFDLWSITSDAKLDVNVKENPLTFTMPDKAVTIEAMTRDATIESEGPGVLGTAAMIGVGVAGTAVLGYQGYMIGTELYLKNVMPAGAAIPTNTAELAKLVWNDAGRPEPVALLAADATDEQKALTWAVENQLISADKAADASVTRWEVIQTWNKEQEMKKV